MSTPSLNKLNKVVTSNAAHIADVSNPHAVIKKASLAIGFADLTATATSQSFDFAATLPATAILVGSYIDVTVAFDDGSTGVFTADVGVKSGDTDAIIDGADIETVAKTAAAKGADPYGFYGGVQVAVLVDAGAVNVDTATAGAMTVELFYIEGDEA